MKPKVPRPCAVDATAYVRPNVETKPDVPRPIIVLVSSVGSIKLLIYWVKPRLVERSWPVLI